MTEGEFADWQTYAAHRMLPFRRLQMQLAQVALVIAQVNGAKDLRLKDFLFDPEPELGAAEEMTADEEADFFDFRPVNKTPKG
jgi:hypothetical protein